MESAPHHPRRTREIPRLFMAGVVRGLMWAGGSTPFLRTYRCATQCCSDTIAGTEYFSRYSTAFNILRP